MNFKPDNRFKFHKEPFADTIKFNAYRVQIMNN